MLRLKEGIEAQKQEWAKAIPLPIQLKRLIGSSTFSKAKDFSEKKKTVIETAFIDIFYPPINRIAI